MKELLCFIISISVVCFVFASCSVLLLRDAAEMDLRLAGYEFKDGYLPKSPTSKVWCKKCPEFGEHAECCSEEK